MVFLLLFFFGGFVNWLLAVLKAIIIYDFLVSVNEYTTLMKSGMIRKGEGMFVHSVTKILIAFILRYDATCIQSKLP